MSIIIKPMTIKNNLSYSSGKFYGLVKQKGPSKQTKMDEKRLYGFTTRKAGGGIGVLENSSNANGKMVINPYVVDATTLPTGVSKYVQPTIITKNSKVGPSGVLGKRPLSTEAILLKKILQKDTKPYVYPTYFDNPTPPTPPTTDGRTLGGIPGNREIGVDNESDSSDDDEDQKKRLDDYIKKETESKKQAKLKELLDSGIPKTPTYDFMDVDIPGAYPQEYMSPPLVPVKREGEEYDRKTKKMKKPEEVETSVPTKRKDGSMDGVRKKRKKPEGTVTILPVKRKTEQGGGSKKKFKKPEESVSILPVKRVSDIEKTNSKKKKENPKFDPVDLPKPEKANPGVKRKGEKQPYRLAKKQNTKERPSKLRIQTSDLPPSRQGSIKQGKAEKKSAPKDSDKLPSPRQKRGKK